ncbi:MAG: hypothetical protein E7099_04095 [Mediterranea massiliensis]|nr:hypothetical protein [Mediterranea massiliensis]
MRKLVLIMLTLLAIQAGYAQERKVPFNGILKDLSGKPFKKARVYVTTPKNYAVVNKLGIFGLTDVQPNDTLKILINKKTYKVPVNSRKSLTIQLDPISGESITMEDHELTQKGFDHTARRERSLGMIVTGEKIRQSGEPNLLKALHGKVPGLNISKDDLGGVSKVSMRGINSFNSDTTPLFVLDGVIIPTIDDVGIHFIDYVEVLKDGSYYGAKGANGAILIFTKQY